MKGMWLSDTGQTDTLSFIRICYEKLRFILGQRPRTFKQNRKNQHCGPIVTRPFGGRTVGPHSPAEDGTPLSQVTVTPTENEPYAVR